MADPQSILQLGIEAARAGDKAEARELFRLVTREDPSNAQGWLWLAGVAEDRAEKRAALERVVQLEPENQLARKGLAALGGAAAGATAAMPASTPPATPEPAPTAPSVDASRAPVTTPNDADQDAFDAFDSIDDYAASPESRRARVYDDANADVPPPAFADDDYDLSDYQNQPGAPAYAPAYDQDDDTTVVVEDEEPRRRGFMAYLPMILILLVLLAGLWFVYQNLFADNATTASNGDGTAASAPADPATGSGDGAVGVIDATETADTDAGATGSAEPAVSDAAGVEGASPAPAGGDPDAVVASPEASAPPTDAAPEASPAVEASPAPEASAPAVEASPAPPAESAAPAPDVASANPAVVPNTEVLTAGQWQFSNSIGGQPISNVTPNAYGGVAPSQGRYLIALITVRNTGTAPAQIPDGFFVIKDAQGRTYDFNRAASADYFRRLAGSGDYAADAQIPPGAPLGSVPLLFDVSADATDLVLFSRENPNQGFLIRQNVQ